jgi:hypothetical protein
MPDAAHKQIASNAVAKAMLTFAAGIAEATTAEFAYRVTDYLADIASSDGCDPETAELLTDLINVIQPPAVSPQRRKFTVINGGAA